MKAHRRAPRRIWSWVALIGLLTGSLPALADGTITVEPALIVPDEAGVVRFSIAVTGVPQPGLRSYALGVRFEGAAVNLVDRINSISQPPRTDKISCAAKLRLGAARETLVPGAGVILESGQGAFVLAETGKGAILALDNRIGDANTARYNIGVAGRRGDVTPSVGAGNLIDFRCLVGEAVPKGARVTVAPGLYSDLAGAIFLDKSGSQPIIDTFKSGTIAVTGKAP